MKRKGAREFMRKKGFLKRKSSQNDSFSEISKTNKKAFVLKLNFAKQVVGNSLLG